MAPSAGMLAALVVVVVVVVVGTVQGQGDRCTDSPASYYLYVMHTDNYTSKHCTEKQNTKDNNKFTVSVLPIIYHAHACIS